MILARIDRRSGKEDACGEWPSWRDLAAGIGPADWRANLVLVDEAEMTSLNDDYRGCAEVTDVLSFSYLESAGRGQPDLAAGERRAALDLWLPAIGDVAAPLAGEIVLAPDFVVRRCAEHGWRVDHEFALLVVHGLLHILGWEHDEPAARKAMAAQETDVLRGSGLPHPLREGE